MPIDPRLLAQALQNIQLKGHDFKTDDSMVLSSLYHPLTALSKAADWTANNVDTAMGVRRPENYDEAYPAEMQRGYTPEQRQEAAFNLAGLAGTGSLPFAPKSAGGVLGTFIGPKAANERYRSLTGEAQARATQDRLKMDLEQRRNSYPLENGMLSDIPVGRLINSGGGSISQSVKPKLTEFEKAHLTAQKNAALPVEQGGLGLPPDNTAMDRARAMGFDVDSPLYHGSSEDVQSIGRGNVFDGLFMTHDKDAALSHGNTLNTFFAKKNSVSPDDIGDYDAAIAHIKQLYPDATDLQIEDVIYPAIVEQRSVHDFDPTEVGDITGLDSGEASWRFQNDRGYIGQQNGYDLIPMQDEHGQSFFAPMGSKVRKSNAAFDPANRNSANILASAAGAGVLAGTLSDNSEAAQNMGAKTQVFHITAPDGKEYEITAPEGATPQDALEKIKALHSTSWGNVAGRAATNFLPSLSNVAGGMVDALAHPMDTVKNVLDVGAGGLQNALPESVNRAIALVDPGADAANSAREKASAVGDFYANRYGSMEGLKNSIANDPAGVMMDASTVLTGGGALAGKLPGMASIGAKTVAAGQSIDPLVLALRASKGVVKLGGNATAELVGALGTHTGGNSVRTAAQAGFQGNNKAADFANNMRGNVSADEMLPELKGALAKLREKRGERYKAGMAGVGADNTVLSMGDIENSINNAMGIKRFKGVSISPTTEGVQAEIAHALEQWKALDPADYHTAEGLDAFKQVIGDIRQNTMPNTPHRAVADQAYNAVKREIIRQAPEYAGVMKDYEQASRLANEIERSLSLGEKASADTAIRKLQSLTRNNANTNYGNRIRLAKELENHGAANLNEKLSGQALSSWQPRGLGGVVAGGAGTYGLMSGNPLAIPVIAAQSPRMVGELALALGKGAGGLSRGARKADSALSGVGLDPKLLAKILYQSNQISEASNAKR